MTHPRPPPGLCQQHRAPQRPYPVDEQLDIRGIHERGQAHSKGSLVDTAARAKDKGVVWLAINSGAPGKQGHGVETNRTAAKAWKMNHPVLLDESGKVGRTYGATNTPHMFVIDKSGKLVYRGAIDNSPDGEGESPTGGKVINYVDAALEDVAAGRAVKTPQTKAYGCGVKFAG